MAYTFKDFAFDVLSKADRPLTYQELWSAGIGAGLDVRLPTKGKTPWQTLGAQLFVEVRDNPESKFIKVGSRPTRFYLRSKQDSLPTDIIKKIEQAEQKIKHPDESYSEQELHPLLTYFAYTNTSLIEVKVFLQKRFLTRNRRRMDTASGCIPTWWVSISQLMIGMKI